MASDFELLSNKIQRLAELTEQLRLENADLRRKVSELSAEKTELGMRMQQAAQRVNALMDKFPASTAKENAS